MIIMKINMGYNLNKCKIGYKNNHLKHINKYNKKFKKNKNYKSWILKKFINKYKFNNKKFKKSKKL